jgi:hypothetical protein
MNLTQLLRYLRYELLDDPQLPCVWGATEDELEDSLLRYLNEALRFLHLRKMKSDPSYYTDIRTVAEMGLTYGKVGNWNTLDLPEYVLSLRRIEIIPDSSDGEAHPLEYVHLVNSDGSTLFGSLRLPSTACTRFTFLGRRRFGIAGTLPATGLRLYFVRRQADMVRFEPISGTTLTFRVTVTASSTRGAFVGRSNYYVGGRVQVIEALRGGPPAAPAPPQEEIRDVTEYAPPGGFVFPTFNFTVGEAFSAAIASGDVIEVIPTLEEEYHELLAYLAAQRAYHREGEISNQLAQSETVKDLWKQFLSSAQFRQGVSHKIPTFDRTW